MLAIQYIKSIPRWLFVKTMAHRFPGLCTGMFGLVQPREVPEPPLPTDRWVRVQPILSGICGSDLASITAEGSPYFSPLTSFPFTFGHEVVGRVTEVGGGVESIQTGDRVVIEPALHCTVRGIEPPCTACAEGRYGNCVSVTQGTIGPGIQTGYCRDTGGGWSSSLVAHENQVFKVPSQVDDASAVLVEPFACALHAVFRSTLASQVITSASSPPGCNVLVQGCGTMGLLTIAALRGLSRYCFITALAKHPHQQELAGKLGASEVVAPGKGALEALCKRTGATLHAPEIGPPTVLGGYDVVFDCVGSPRSLDQALRFTRSRGQTLLVGMPGIPRTVDWTTIWYKELQVLGTYTYGVESWDGHGIRTFELALQLLRDRRVNLRELVTHRFPLGEFRQAIRTALLTGPTRSVKTVFDLTTGPEADRAAAS